MTKFTPIPERLSLALPLRARRILENTRVRSCEELLALGEQGMLRVANCGQKTLDALQRLQRRVLKQFPGLRPHYTAPLALAPRVPVNPLVWKSPQRTKPADDPPPSCGPADWSILNRSLSDLFQLPPLPPDGEPAPEANIATLGLPTAELERLRAIALFPEDPIHLLGSLSLGYLSQAGLSDIVFSIFHAALARCHGLAGPALPSVASAQVRDSSLYTGIAPDLLDSLAVLDFPCSILHETETGCRPTAVPFSTLAKITERTVIKRLGLSSAALRDIGNLWLLQERAASVQWSARAGLPSRAYGDFYRLADAYLDLALSRIPSKQNIEAHRRMLRGRLRLPDGRKRTLKELGKREGVTRERVRQVECQIMEVLKGPELLQHLGYLWQLLDHLLVSGGGVRYLSELAGSLAETLGWPSTPGEALASIVELSPNYQVIWDAPIRVVLARNCCARCAAIGVVVTNAVEAAPDGVISFEAVLEKAQKSCWNSRCPELGKIAGFSKSIVHCVADTLPGILIRDEQLVAPHVQPREVSHRELLEQILFNARNGMHFADIHLEHNAALPGRPLTPKQVYSALTVSQSCLLWGAGTFIHRDLVSLPSPLIADIQDDIEKRLSSHDVPYLCLNGTIFDHYRDRLSSQCVHTPLALYSCMRLLGSAALDFSEYPYVQRKDGSVPRPTLLALLEDFLLNRPGPVSWGEVKEFGLITLGMAKWQLAHLRHAPNVLQIGKAGFFLHHSHLSPVLDAVTELARDRVNSAGAIPLSVESLYHHNAAKCNEVGIKSVACLTYLIKRFFPRIELIRNRPDPRAKRINIATTRPLPR